MAKIPYILKKSTDDKLLQKISVGLIQSAGENDERNSLQIKESRRYFLNFMLAKDI